MTNPTTPLSPERLAEARALLRYESSISFHSARAKESMLLLLAEAEEAARLRARVAELEAAQRQIRAIHTDSPMGPCPTCFDSDAYVAGGDGLVSHPCPTARLADAEPVEPSHVRAAGGAR
ncbi:hypothetical protein [Streptomyces sp. 891-h]|uniref:hypothetical protein n=1 Tax=Streptomyces sp. 891-h TaxID=2720714 RepID=UPI001FA9DB39|nr:hypothetical protein [Streptomyces sp. 891-h]UNZ20573.1 hypothetical protein HC362_29450 [Streptomyces sp. 891-h]